MTDVFKVQSDIATQVAQALGGALGAGEEKRLAEKPTENLAAYDAFLKGEEISKALAVNDPPTVRRALGYYEQVVALDPSFAQGWARVSMASSLLYANALPDPRLAERARQAADKALALEPGRPEGYHALGNVERLIVHDMARAREQYAKGLRLAPNSVDLLGATSGAEQAMGLGEAALEHAKQAERLDPRSVSAARRVGVTLFLLRRYPEAITSLDRAIALSPSNVNAIEYRAMASLGQGDLAGARAVLRSATKDVERTALVAYVAQYNDLGWVLDEEQHALLLRLTPDAFDGDRAALEICLAQAYAVKGDAANTRAHAEEARKGFEDQLREAPDDDQRHILMGLAFAYLGKKEEAVREGLRAVELMPIAKDAISGAYDQNVLARIYILIGEPEKALDRLEPLLKIPGPLSPGWLKIDPNFDPLRGNPRFQKLVAGAK
jgi:tetratricopeptide (TPR) repeat protein